MHHIHERTADAWGDYVEAYIKRGWKSYLLTFMFEPLPGRQTIKMSQMARYLEIAYGIFVTRGGCASRRLRATRGSAPIWLCMPDLPCFKRKKYSLRDVVPNDGLHYHAILLLPPWSRIDDVELHFESLRSIYLRRADARPRGC